MKQEKALSSYRGRLVKYPRQHLFVSIEELQRFQDCVKEKKEASSRTIWSYTQLTPEWSAARSIDLVCISHTRQLYWKEKKEKGLVLTSSH